MKIIFDGFFWGGKMAIKQSDKLVYNKRFNIFTPCHDTVKTLEPGEANIRVSGLNGKWTTMDISSDSVICVSLRNYFKFTVWLLVLLFTFSSFIIENALLDWAVISIAVLFLGLILLSTIDSRIIYHIEKL